MLPLASCAAMCPLQNSARPAMTPTPRRCRRATWTYSRAVRACQTRTLTYFIKHGSIIWAGAMSHAAIEAGRAHDRYLKRGRKPRGIRMILAWIKAALARLFG